MKLIKTLSFIALGAALTTATFADPGKGHGQGHGNAGNYSGSYPPGLSSKPHGLEKQNKTPEGWSKGKKKGWMKCRKGDNSCSEWSAKHPDWNTKNPEWKRNHQEWDNNYREWRKNNCRFIDGKWNC